jgi:hypothetical protein
MEMSGTNRVKNEHTKSQAGKEYPAYNTIKELNELVTCCTGTAL